jgi:hypothetical protein
MTGVADRSTSRASSTIHIWLRAGPERRQPSLVPCRPRPTPGGFRLQVGSGIHRAVSFFPGKAKNWRWTFIEAATYGETLERWSGTLYL